MFVVTVSADWLPALVGWKLLESSAELWLSVFGLLTVRYVAGIQFVDTITDMEKGYT